jgi:hypothetical protein
LHIRRTEERIAIFGDVGNGENFLIAETGEAFTEAGFGFIVRETRGALASGREARWKFVETVDAGYFFDEIDFALDVGAPGGLGAFPSGEERAFGAAVLINTHRRKAEGAEARFDFLVVNVGAHHAKEFGAG